MLTHTRSREAGVRKVWQTPRLRVHGSLAEITLADKSLGPSDGLILEGIGAIGDAS